MDDVKSIKNAASTIDEFRARLIQDIQNLRDSLDRHQALLDHIEEGSPARLQVTEKYDVIDDIVPLVRSSRIPMSQSEIFATLKSTVMQKLNYTEKEAQSNVYRSLAYHAQRGPGAKDDRGIRAVELVGDSYKIVPFRTKGTRTQYPDNLIWHVSKLEK
jgi:hypothetical protein